MITRLYEFYRMLAERAFEIKDTGNLILLRDISAKEVKLCLYDYVNNNIVGYVTADNASKDEFFTIDRVSADKGWGPFMYALILQTLYPKYIKPSYIIRPAALKVWKEFFSNDNIITKELSTDDKNYTASWEPAKGFDPDGYDDRYTYVINTLFSMTPYEWYQPFLIDSDNAIRDNNINAKQIFRQCLDFFHDKYYATSESITVPTKDVSDKYLMVLEKGSSIQLMIQCKSKIYGYAEVLNKQTYFQIINIAAEPGYGPYLYDTLMLWLDKPVRPSHSITSEALSVWMNYLNNRPDVIKKNVTKDVWDEIDLDQRMSTSSSAIEPLNYLYTIKDKKRSTDVTDWWYNSEQQFVNQMVERLPGWKEIRFNQAKMWFNNKYPVYA